MVREGACKAQKRSELSPCCCRGTSPDCISKSGSGRFVILALHDIWQSACDHRRAHFRLHFIRSVSFLLSSMFIPFRPSLAIQQSAIKIPPLALSYSSGSSSLLVLTKRSCHISLMRSARGLSGLTAHTLIAFLPSFLFTNSSAITTHLRIPLPCASRSPVSTSSELRVAIHPYNGAGELAEDWALKRCVEAQGERMRLLSSSDSSLYFSSYPGSSPSAENLSLARRATINKPGAVSSNTRVWIAQFDSWVWIGIS